MPCKIFSPWFIAKIQLFRDLETLTYGSVKSEYLDARVGISPFVLAQKTAQIQARVQILSSENPSSFIYRWSPTELGAAWENEHRFWSQGDLGLTFILYTYSTSVKLS